ncbi:MAG: type II toxin-antitoxin system VapC family toxin [Candidatus Binataceae bacterium]
MVAAAPKAYFDTSVLVKGYLGEDGSRLARDLTRRFRLVSCAIVYLEAASAFSRRRVAGEIDERAYQATTARLRADRAHWELVGVNDSLLTRAEEVITRTTVRALDALHIAAALVFQESSGMRLPFITADARQANAARSMGLQVTPVPPA